MTHQRLPKALSLASPLVPILLLLAAPSASGLELLYSTGWSNLTTAEAFVCSSPALRYEAADDFDVVGSIERITFNGDNGCLSICSPPPVVGVRIRFFAWTATGPGPLQSEVFLPNGTPGFFFDSQNVEDLDITLPQPFLATGKHYLSVSLEFAGCFDWRIWIANPNATKGGAAFKRTNGGPWTPVTSFSVTTADLSFALYGTAGPPTPPLGCGVWEVLPSPNAPGMDDTWLNDLAVLGENDVWAVGRTFGTSSPSDKNQYTFAMHFDGAQWTIFPTPSPNPAPELTWCELSAVAALGTNDVWAAGVRVDQDNGPGYVGPHNLVLHWDGSSWQQMPAPIPASFGAQGVSGDHIEEILALAPNDIWFLGEWIRMNAQGQTFRHALAMHYDGSSFTVHDVPVVGSNGATIYAADALGPNDIWAAGAAGDGDPGTANFSFVYHWDGSSWSYVDPGPMPGTFHTFGGVKMLGKNDVWISGSAWSPPNVVTPFMLHWDGSGFQLVTVPFAGGPILGEPPAMIVFGSGGASLFDGVGFHDAHLFEGFDELIGGFNLGGIVETGACRMLAVGSQHVASQVRTLVARLEPLAWTDLGQGKAGAAGVPVLLASGSLAATSSNRIDLTGAAPSSLALFVAGTSLASAPFLGGTLLPTPQVVLPLPTGPDGALTLPFTVPQALPAATALTVQCWIADPAASFGASASNGVRGTSP